MYNFGLLAVCIGGRGGKLTLLAANKGNEAVFTAARVCIQSTYLFSDYFSIIKRENKYIKKTSC